MEQGLSGKFSNLHYTHFTINLFIIIRQFDSLTVKLI